jgi:hypothetical protein
MAEASTEVKTESVVQIPIVVNTADNPNLLSVTSVTPLTQNADQLPKTDADGKPIVEEKVTPTKEVVPEPVKEVMPPVKDPVQKRIDEITKKRREAERERDYERQKREEAEAALAAAKKAIPATGKPKAEDFKTEEEFLEALTDWKVDQRLAAREEQVAKTTSEAQEKETVNTVYQELDEKIDKGRSKYNDFDEVVLAEDLNISDAMVEAIAFSDSAEDVLYYLGKHPDESEAIAKMPPIMAARELGKVEAKLNPTKPVRKTNAPPPITPVKVTGAIEKRPEDMTFSEYVAWRNRPKA